MSATSNILLIDKPSGWTSFDVVAKVRGELRKKQVNAVRKFKVGHAGTLDPFATGLLVVLLGDECKKASEYLKLNKTYEFNAKLGEVSTTGDPEGDKKITSDTIPTEKAVLKTLEQFKGHIMQRPPAFSAIKVNGQRAYKLARAGKSVEIPEREVVIYRLELIEYSYPYLKCRCEVSSGTYIRTLVEDIGESLGTGAYCQELRRTQIGKYSISDAKTLEARLNSLI